MLNRVLIADDAAFLRAMLREILRKNGFEVVAEAENGMEAITKYHETRPDVVTMDITMPKLDGIAAMREICKLDPNARVIICSELGQQHRVIEAIQQGALDFIVKPFRPERVIQALRKVCGEGPDESPKSPPAKEYS